MPRDDRVRGEDYGLSFLHGALCLRLVRGVKVKVVKFIRVLVHTQFDRGTTYL